MVIEDLLFPRWSIGSQFSLLDYGCGFCDLYPWLKRSMPDADIDYFGYDKLAKVLEMAVEKNVVNPRKLAYDLKVLEGLRFDYVVACGVFNLKVDGESREQWFADVLRQVDWMWQHCEKAIVFNQFSVYHDFEAPELRYSDPSWWMGYLGQRYSRHVAVRVDYGPYEFSVSVRRESWIR